MKDRLVSLVTANESMSVLFEEREEKQDMS